MTRTPGWVALSEGTNVVSEGGNYGLPHSTSAKSSADRGVQLRFFVNQFLSVFPVRLGLPPSTLGKLMLTLVMCVNHRCLSLRSKPQYGIPLLCQGQS